MNTHKFKGEYESPSIDVIEIGVEGNFLQGSAGLEGQEKEDWFTTKAIFGHETLY